LLSFIYMKLSLSFIILVFSTISILVSAQGILPEQWTLQDCVAQATERNITVQRAKLQVALAGNNLDGSRWAYTPNLNLGTNYFWNFGLNIDPVTNQISQQIYLLIGVFTKGEESIKVLPAIITVSKLHV
jgi:outer membrane protein TolC